MSEERSGIQQRWTPGIAAEGFTPVASIFLDSYAGLGITTPEAMFLIQLISFKWDKNEPFPSFATLAKRMGISTTAARNQARSLEKKGFLQRNRRFSQSNTFNLQPLFTALEKVKATRGSRVRKRVVQPEVTQ